MLIYEQKVNHIQRPLGFRLDSLCMQYKVACDEASAPRAARLRVYRDGAPVYDSGLRDDVDGRGFAPELTLAPRTRYEWDVSVRTDVENAVSEREWFETGKRDEGWTARWIAPDNVQGDAVMVKRFKARGPVARARLYICGLGLYEAHLGGARVGDEHLTPGCNAYDQWLQVQTYDVTGLVAKDNELRVTLSDGWYKGRFGFRGNEGCVYGDSQALIAELILTYADGSEETVATDPSWRCTESNVRFANIYDGEFYDATFVPGPERPVRLIDLGLARLTDRMSLPVLVKERLSPAKLIVTPKNELVLDMGQIMTGWLSFRARGEAGHRYHLRYGEVLQNDCFYADNLRTAKAEYTYVSDGVEREIAPRFTFYGFRYVLLEGFGDAPALSDFTGCVVYSDVERTLWQESGSPKADRLALNALWGQKGNFVDVPTDCPQRDERMGWTGDAQAFCATACYQMDCAAFYAKYLYDMRNEQRKYAGGVPHVVPAFDLGGACSCAWADAACIIPWTLYLFYGDKELLRSQYPNMKGWIDWIHSTDEATGGARLWRVGFHFADWLALDTDDGTPIGATDPYYVASAFYFHSATLTAKAARVLGLSEDAMRYERLAGEVRAAMLREYFTATGRLAVTTQTAYILALWFGIAPEAWTQRLADDLDAKLDACKGELRTGFVGTSYLCRTLTRFGLNRRAYSLFLRESYPGWLYEVNMGATTVWERWNSILPDGTISDTGMNSLNHYAYGAVMEWVYRDAAGLAPVEDAPGFKRAVVRPHPDPRLGALHVTFNSPMGLYESGWRIEGDRLFVRVRVPFGAQADVVLPYGPCSGPLAFTREGDDMRAVAAPGLYEMIYTPENAPWARPDIDTPLGGIARAHPDLWREMLAIEPALAHAAPDVAVRGIRKSPFLVIDPVRVERLEGLLRGR